MEGDNSEGYSKDWLKEYVTQRSPERVKEATKKVFDRMRVVETIFARRSSLGELPQAEMEQKTVAVIQKYNQDMEHTIKTASQDVKDDPESGFYYVPLDTSPEVVHDGVRWFSELKRIGEGDLKFENVGIDELVRKLYKVMAKEGLAEEVLGKAPVNSELLDVVRVIVGEEERTKEINPVGKSESRGVAAGLNAVGARLEQAQGNMTEWIAKIGPDINTLYAKTATPGNSKE
jgi:predicted transcriptional regulator